MCLLVAGRVLDTTVQLAKMTIIAVLLYYPRNILV